MMTLAGALAKRAPPQSQRGAVALAWDTMEQIFPSISTRCESSKQCRSDATCVELAMNAAWEQAGWTKVLSLVKLAEDLQGRRKVHSPLACWMAAIKKAKLLDPLPWKPPGG